MNINGYTLTAIIFGVYFTSVSVNTYFRKNAEVAIAAAESQAKISDNERIVEMAKLSKGCK